MGKVRINTTDVKKAFKQKTLMTAISMVCAVPAWSAPIALTGDYIRIGTNEYGTLGSGDDASPGILYDNTGSGNFNTSYDYLTPGTAFEGFTVKATSGGTTYSVSSNNASSYTRLTGSLSDASSGSYQGVSWAGSYSDGGTKLFDIVNTVGFNESDKRVKLTTTIKAAEGLTDVYFARYMDPDAQAAPGDSSSTNNIRGNGDVSANNLVYAEAQVSKYVIGLYSAAESNVNTGITSPWSEAPEDYYAGTDAGNGDNAIGIAYYSPTINADGSITYTYYYIFGSDIAAAVADNVSGFSVLESTQALKNSPAFSGARVIDETPELLQLFTAANLSSTQQVSEAASQTLPLLTGGGFMAARSALYGINGAVKARQRVVLGRSTGTGLNSGDALLQDKYFWIKPFGTRTEQDDRNGVSGYDADTGGLVLGLDGSFGQQTRVGVAFAYANTRVDGNSNTSPHKLDVDSYQLIGYGSHNLGNDTDVTFQIDFGQNRNEGERTIQFNSTKADADYDSYTAHLGLGLSRSYDLNSANRATAGLKTDYTWIRDESYRETGAGLLNLDVDSNTTEALVVGVEGQLSHSVSQSTELGVNLGLGYDVLNEQASITSSYAGAPSAQFTTDGIDPNPWIATGGFGLTHVLEAGAELSASYDAEYRSDYLSQSVSLKLRWAF